LNDILLTGTGLQINTDVDENSIVLENTLPNATHTGDVTGSGALTIAANAVTNAKMANMTASTIKGRITTTGAPQDLTVAQVKTLLGLPATTITHTKATTVETPTTADLIPLFWTTKALTITSIRAIGTGGTSNAFNIRTSTTVVAGGGTNIGGTTVSSGTGGFNVTVSSSTVAANSWVFYDGGTNTGGVTQFHVTIAYTEN